MEMQRQREIEKQKQKELEEQKQREIEEERQKVLELERLRQIELEKQREWEEKIKQEIDHSEEGRVRLPDSHEQPGQGSGEEAERTRGVDDEIEKRKRNTKTKESGKEENQVHPREKMCTEMEGSIV